MTDVRLIAVRIPVSIHRFRTKLNPGVAVTWSQLHIHGKLTNFYLNVGPDVLVVRHVLFGMPNDRAVFERPVTIVALPTGEVIAIEEHGALTRLCVLLGRRRGNQQQAAEE